MENKYYSNKHKYGKIVSDKGLKIKALFKMKKGDGRMNFTVKGYTNRVASFCYSIINFVLVVAYIIEFIKGARTIVYLATVLAFTILPTIAVWVLYRRNNDSKAIQHVMGVCYSSFYLFCIFTTNSQLAFAYAFPMFMVVTLYCDTVYCAELSVGALIGNIVAVIYMQNKGVEMASADVTIRIAAVALVGGFMMLTCVAMKKISQYRTAEISSQKEKSEVLLHNTMEISAKMTAGIFEANEKMTVLGNSVEQIKTSMKEVNDGNSETAEAVQQQLLRTEEIQKYIADVKKAVAGMNEDMKKANVSVKTGLAHVSEMAVQVEKSKEANCTVNEKMAELTEYTDKMNSIIGMINSITGKTGLLALNASIEAARAGEAGRGFAVVAGEISTLANQTKEATVNITEMIDSINRELASVTEAIALVTSCNESHAVSAGAVEGSFGEIAGEVDGISVKVGEMVEVVDELGIANDYIVESIQTISAISEEVSAHSGETYDACEDNSIMVVEVTQIINGLNEQAQKLNS